ncbi:uncharacterized protein T551_02502 [Pneumocystis jirovecii RU7]|uniref:Phosphatidic acid phosphatase type 2/haloperoxidase domain-containing protein n=1 Tax=Pneumocystis jirovecii (strain RU7) TaxID=1408657 RepID=A0A0W4ZJV5_PNEJ7|nr:uncharacterized protein T551_02502 [Pneumocystis jirovecii RU7]KTW28652.1 hypothetical protein T551_02502 [Pneumocystis jirovecii RU7]
MNYILKNNKYHKNRYIILKLIVRSITLNIPPGVRKRHCGVRSTQCLYYISAFLALSPLAILIVYVTLIYNRREAELLLMYAGQVVCDFLNTQLKHIFQQARPSAIISDYGMPSNHAQFISYFAGYLLLWCFFRAQNLPQHICIRNMVILIVSVISVCFSRVYLHFHTVWQVIVGFFVGAVFSVFWFFFISLLRKIGLIDVVLRSWPNNYLYIKDTMNKEHNTIKKEWETWTKSNFYKQK